MIRQSLFLMPLAAASLGFLSACTGVDDGARARQMPQAGLAPQVSQAPQADLVPQTGLAPPTFAGPVLDGSGVCTGAAPAAATAIAPGIGECELVRLKGKPPTDVLVGEGRSGREVQVLYNEPGAKELYFFVNNRLDRIVKS